MRSVLPDSWDHNPVLVNSFITAASPVSGTWVDCTFGSGGYSRALIEAGAAKVIAIDRDPDIYTNYARIRDKFGGKLKLFKAKFSSLKNVVEENYGGEISGIVFDIGVSSMQIDKADRGFSFKRDGPLDMRMSREGTSAFDIVNEATEADIANIIYFYGEERAARKIAKLIVLERARQPISTTFQLAEIISRAVKMLKIKSKRPLDPTARTFQALRIAVNDELNELQSGLLGAEKVLPLGGVLAIVSFHSLEDRLVKRFIKSRSQLSSGRSRFLPDQDRVEPTFKDLSKKVITPSKKEVLENSRARSAKLRICVKVSEKADFYDRIEPIIPHVNFNVGEL